MKCYGKPDKSQNFTKHKAPAGLTGRGFAERESGVDLLSRARCSLSLALLCFTVLFGMGRGGTRGLLTPDVTCTAAAAAQNEKKVL